MNRICRSLAVFTLFLGACGAEEEGMPSGADCPEGSTLTYDSFAKSFLESYCTRCHSNSLTGSARNGAPNDHNFDTLALVQEQLDHIDGSAAAGADAVNESMPIGTPTPTEEERRQLGEWIACGAP